jgi:hypothetical protein
MTASPTQRWIRVHAFLLARGMLVLVLAGCSQALPSATAEPSLSDLPQVQAAASPSPTPGVPSGPYGPEDLPDIVLTEDRWAPYGFRVDGTLAWIPALEMLLRDGLAERQDGDSADGIDLATLRDALMTKLSTTDAGEYVSWAAVFETVMDSDLAYHYLAREHQSPDGWGLQPGNSDTELGWESVLYVGPAHGWNRAGIYLWRWDNLVLAAVGVGDYDEDQLRFMADLMEGRR